MIEYGCSRLHANEIDWAKVALGKVFQDRVYGELYVNLNEDNLTDLFSDLEKTLENICSNPYILYMRKLKPRKVKRFAYYNRA